MNLEGNPGPSVINAAEDLHERVTAVFGEGHRVFSIFPAFGNENWTELIAQADDDRVTFRNEVAQAEIDHLVGDRVELSGSTECLAIDLGEGHPLLALIPDDDSREGEAPAGAHFFLGLDSEWLAACHYHQRDWRAVAAAGVELFAGLGPEADDGDVRREAARCCRRSGDSAGNRRTDAIRSVA